MPNPNPDSPVTYIWAHACRFPELVNLQVSLETPDIPSKYINHTAAWKFVEIIAGVTFMELKVGVPTI